MDIDNKIAFLESNLKRHLDWIVAADAKLPPYFALATVMLGVLAALAPCFSQWTTLSLLLVFISLILLFAALFMLAFSAFPRTKGPKGSMIYFGGICEKNCAKFVNEIKDLTRDSYLDDLANQCHRNATIAKKKYSWIKRAVICLFLSLPFWLASVYILYRWR